jgi:UDP-N-acetylmuramyl pentapeptide phosphotransferase/UDP-N-acetylglucosamine-1-phosphate transferase
VFGIFFLANKDLPYAVLAFTFGGSLFAFLYYNMFPAKIFMGDTGALMLGLVISILVIRFIQVGTTYSFFPVSASPAVGFAVLILPLMDTMRVFVIRIIQGRSPFSPDRNHIHHLFLRNGFNPKTATISCVSYTIFTSIAAFTFQNFGATLLLTVLVMLFFCLVYFLHLGSEKHMRVNKGPVHSGIQKNEIVLSFFENKRATVEED